MTFKTSNYRRGREKEYRVKKQLESEGWTVIRASGSHGFADLVAIRSMFNEIKFVQCKLGDFSETKKAKLIEENKRFTGTYNVTYEVL